MPVPLPSQRSSFKDERWFAACPNEDCEYIVFRTANHCKECGEIYGPLAIDLWEFGRVYEEITPYNYEDPDDIWGNYWEHICLRCDTHEDGCTCPDGAITPMDTSLLWSQVEYSEVKSEYDCNDCIKQYQSACPGLRQWLLVKHDEDRSIGEIEVCHKFMRWQALITP